MNKIKILTGEVHSGKTTKLFRFISSKNSVDGILAPIVNGRRHLFDISSKTLKQLEVSAEDESTVSVGNYNFLKESFSWANAKLIEGFNRESELIIIDEIGKLELQKLGLYEGSKYILENAYHKCTDIILVVRDYLLEDVINSFNLNDKSIDIITLSDLLE